MARTFGEIVELLSGKEIAFANLMIDPFQMVKNINEKFHYTMSLKDIPGIYEGYEKNDFFIAWFNKTLLRYYNYYPNSKDGYYRDNNNHIIKAYVVFMWRLFEIFGEHYLELKKDNSNLRSLLIDVDKFFVLSY